MSCSMLSTIGVARGGLRGLAPPPPQRMRKKYQGYSLVNLTLNMLYKNGKNIKFVITSFVFFQLPAGEAYDAPPDTLSAGDSPPRSTPSVSRTRRLGSQAPSTQDPGYASAVDSFVCTVILRLLVANKTEQLPIRPRPSRKWHYSVVLGVTRCAVMLWC